MRLTWCSGLQEIKITSLRKEYISTLLIEIELIFSMKEYTFLWDSTGAPHYLEWGDFFDK